MDDSWPMWSQPARSRVLLALCDSRAPVAGRELARLAHVSPTTALRIAKELVRSKEVLRVREQGISRYAIAPGAFRELRRRRPHRDSKAQLEYLRRLDAPVWVVDASELLHRGVTRRVSTFVVMPRSWRQRFEVPVPVVLLEHARPLERRGEEADRLDAIELLLALLKHDLVAARQLYEVKPPSGGARRRLLRRLHQEGLETAAASARIPLDTRPWMVTRR